MTTMEAPITARIRAEDLLTMEGGDRVELEDGEIKERCMSPESSWIGGKLYKALDNAAEAAGGVAFPTDVQLRIWADDPDRVRRPDACYVAPGGLAGDRPPSRGFVTVAPAIVVEVVSPNDLAEELHNKVEQYREAGVALVWVVYPESRTVHAWRLDGTGTVLRPGGRLTGEGVLPAFDIAVEALFPAPEPTPAEAPAASNTEVAPE